MKAPERHLSLRDLVTDVIRGKLLRRTRHQKGELSLPDLENGTKTFCRQNREAQGVDRRRRPVNTSRGARRSLRVDACERSRWPLRSAER